MDIPLEREYLHFSGISHWNQHYHWNSGLSPGCPCQGGSTAALPGLFLSRLGAGVAEIR